MITTQLSEQTDLILTNAVKRFLTKCPDALFRQDFCELKHDAWILLPGVRSEYEARTGGSFIPFAIQRLAWRLLDLARNRTWAPRSVNPDDRKKQYLIAPVGSDTEGEMILNDVPGLVTNEHPASQFIEEDAVRGLANKLKKVIPGEYRETFELYYVSGHTMRETSELLGITESRVSQRLSLARTLIHERFPNRTGLIA